jgi:hypothetical protein
MALFVSAFSLCFGCGMQESYQTPHVFIAFAHHGYLCSILFKLKRNYSETLRELRFFVPPICATRGQKNHSKFFHENWRNWFYRFSKNRPDRFNFFGENRLQKFEVTRHLKFSKV